MLKCHKGKNWSILIIASFKTLLVETSLNLSYTPVIPCAPSLLWHFIFCSSSICVGQISTPVLLVPQEQGRTFSKYVYPKHMALARTVTCLVSLD